MVLGSRGLVGSAIVRRLQKEGFSRIIQINRQDADLIEQNSVRDLFRREKPEFVFLAAAKVGGIVANRDHKAEFIYQNFQIQSNVIHSAWENGVFKLLFLGSSCIYPRMCPQPIKEEYLMSGPLEETNDSYATAKIAGIKMCQSYNLQYGTDYICVMPTNLYGQNDNFDLTSSHVLPAMIRRFHEAEFRHDPRVVLWGSGTPKREFLHVDDLADALLYLMQTYHGSEIVNIGTGEDVTIKELAECIKNTVGYKGEVVWDTDKPDGTPRKLLDVSRLHALGWRHQISLADGIGKTFEWYKSNYGQT